MKTIYPFLFLVLCSLTHSYGQTDTTAVVKKPTEMTVDLLGIYSPILSKDFYGFNFDLKWYVQEKWATGFSLSFAGKQIDEDFGYVVGRPLVNHLELGWVNQYDIVKNEKFRFGVDLTNGVLIARLFDKDVREEMWTEFGPQEVPKRIRTNTFYMFEPGINASVRLFKYERFPDIYLTTKAKYRVAVGSARFGNTDDFTNYYFGVGISLMGFKDLPRQN